MIKVTVDTGYRVFDLEFPDNTRLVEFKYAMQQFAKYHLTEAETRMKILKLELKK